MAFSIEPQTKKQEEIREGIENFLNFNSVLVLPRIGGGRFEHHMRDISVAVDTLHNALEGSLDTLYKEAESNGIPVTCSKGCSYCCSQPVSCEVPEAIFIVNQLNEDEDTLKNFLSKYGDWRKNFNPHEYSQAMNREIDLNINGLSKGQVHNSFKKFNSAECPFIMDDACSIYPYRPTVCRAMLSLDDPEKCNRGEYILMVQGRSFQEIVQNKQLQVYSEIVASLGTKAHINSPLPLLVYEIFQGGRKYLERLISESNNQIRQGNFPHFRA